MADGTVFPNVEAPIHPAPLAATGSDSAFFASWLRQQCGAIDGARAGVVYATTGGGRIAPAAVWPEGQTATPQLARLAERAGTSDHPLIAWSRSPGSAAVDLLIGVGITLHGATAATVALRVEMPDGVEKADPEAIASRLRLGAGWLEARLSERRAEIAISRLARAAVAMDIVAVASAQRGSRRAAMAVVNELATKLGCDRVSLGLVRFGRIKLKALSHSATFQQRGRVVDAIGNAMEECLVQEAVVSYTPPLAMRAPISVAHRDLVAVTQGPGAAASVPLAGRSGPVGVLTFERKGEAPFDQETLLLAEAAGTLLGPVLAIHAAGDRLVAGRIADAIRDGIALVLGKERPSLKLAVIAAAALVTYLSFATGDYRVTSRAVLEGEVQRAAVAPFDGFVAASAVRPGDHVGAGEVLAALDDRELVLDRARAWADHERLRQKYDEAMAKHDRPTAAMLTAQIEQADAQLELAEDKLSRARVVSPIDGLLVSGDLTQMLGSPVERGKTLFEIAPLDRYRIVLRTDERDLRFVSVGNTGALSLAGMPGERFGFTVSRITPIAEAKDGKNEFRVEARLNEPPGPRLRPGMEGVGKIETGSHHLIWIWTHGIADWMRLLVWKWWP